MTKNYVFTKNDVKWIKKQTHKSSNNLVDILDDKKKVDDLNKDYHYRQSVLPRLEKLRQLMWNENKPSVASHNDIVFDVKLVEHFIEDLKNNPQHRLVSDEMKRCNELWKKYK